MQKEPEHYGITRHVNEGHKPVNNFQYLEDLAYEDLFLTLTRAFHRRDFPLEHAANRAMRGKYLNSVNLWIEEVDKRNPDIGYEAYLECLSEIVRVGVNDHPQELIALWPYLKERADVLFANLRLSHDSFARRKHQYDNNIVDALTEQQELEMMAYGR